jgi:hypothetical protein
MSRVAVPSGSSDRTRTCPAATNPADWRRVSTSSGSGTVTVPQAGTADTGKRQLAEALRFWNRSEPLEP